MTMIKPHSNHIHLRFFSITLLAISFFIVSGCSTEQDTNTTKNQKTVELEVTATAYTSHPNQTDKTPFLAAWNNVLKPGIQSIAVSRDLLKMGLGNGSKVTIEGLPGEFLVLDKMNKRWEKKIDIYMGLDHQGAKEWGKKTVKIRWAPKANTTVSTSN